MQKVTKEGQVNLRTAFLNGVLFRDSMVASSAEVWRGYRTEAERRYPDPVVTRMRVVRDPDGAVSKHIPDFALWYAARDGQIFAFYQPSEEEARHFLSQKGYGIALSKTEDWRASLIDMFFPISKARLSTWADLLTNPTETVPE